MLDELQRRYPDLVFDIEVDVTANLHQKLLRGDVDIAFLADPIQGPDLRVSPLMELEMCWAGSARHIKSGQRTTPAQLAAQPVITLSRVSSLHAQTHNWFAAHDLQPRRLHVCNSVALLMRLVELGMGVAILPRILVTPDSGLHHFGRSNSLANLSLVSALHVRNSGRPAEIVSELAVEFAQRWVAAR
jgi:DNA-binding transcriptional LysR family regulator